jgi:hypothetical protein
VSQRESLEEQNAREDPQCEHDPAPPAISDRTADDLHGQTHDHRQAEKQADGRYRDTKMHMEVDRLEGKAEVIAEEVNEGAGYEQPEVAGKATDTIGQPHPFLHQHRFIS